MSARLRIVAIAVLASLCAGAHCNEDCGAPGVHLVGARQLERTLYGPGVLALSGRSASLAGALSAFERRELVVDVSRPVAVVLARAGAGASPALTHADGSKLVAGARGNGFKVVALVEQRGTVPLFEDPGALADAERERWDAVLLIPRDQRDGPWEASVAVRLGRRVARRNDPGSGRCVEPPGEAPALPEWNLFALPARCGDGVLQDGEDCDDGNRAGGDGCSSWCFKER